MKTLKSQPSTPSLVAFSSTHLKRNAREQLEALLKKVNFMDGPLTDHEQFAIYQLYASLGVTLTAIHGCAVSNPSQKEKVQ